MKKFCFLLKLKNQTTKQYYIHYFCFVSFKDIKLPLYNLIYGGSYRTLWSISIAWLILVCHFGYGGLLNFLLSCKLFLPLANLSYSVSTPVLRSNSFTYESLLQSLDAGVKLI